MIKFTLPWPPTNNTYWRKWRNRTVLSNEGRLYCAKVHSIVAKRHVKKLLGRLEIVVASNPPDKRVRDLDNLWKGTLDSLQKAGVYEDDSQIDFESMVRWHNPYLEKGTIQVWLKEIQDIKESQRFYKKCFIDWCRFKPGQKLFSTSKEN